MRNKSFGFMFDLSLVWAYTRRQRALWTVSQERRSRFLVERRLIGAVEGMMMMMMINILIIIIHLLSKGYLKKHRPVTCHTKNHRIAVLFTTLDMFLAVVTAIGLFSDSVLNVRKHILSGSTGNHPAILVRL